MTSIEDLFFAFGDWLKTTPLPKLVAWIVTTPVSKLVDSNVWIAPVVQTTHILAIAATVGSVLMIALRIYGAAGKSRTLAETAARYTPWIWGALAVLLITGLILIFGEPARELLNPSFWSKMILLAVGVVLTLGFQGAVSRNADAASASPQGTLALRVGAAAMILIWCAIILFGRWIAYTPT